MSKKSILDTGVRKVKNVGGFHFGSGSLEELPTYVETRRAIAREQKKCEGVVFLVDHFFRGQEEILARIGAHVSDRIAFVETKDEPTTDGIDQLTRTLIAEGYGEPAALVGMGGGITMDTAKAVSNLLTNGGRAAQYQGWDLVKRPGIYKIAVPTISGTGAEATRTCVMINKENGLKLGMNSDHTVFDQIVMDPDLTATVPRNQFFYTGMDAYIHSVESLSGSYRNPVGDAYSRETIQLCRDVFLEGDMMSSGSREKLMVASYLGGCAIATSYVGLVHPFSAGLSVVLGLHHCVANCIALNAMEEFYPDGWAEFTRMARGQNISIPEGVCARLDEAGFRALYDATVIHEKPLTNALGEDFRAILTYERVVEIFQRM
ncbi:MAG: iron-containing alcohol dehydrogenase [Chthoniobacterales bacterium]|nr:iron-containing alcohol dehydrogenase [Chthoniobacterales bacterium]